MRRAILLLGLGVIVCGIAGCSHGADANYSRKVDLTPKEQATEKANQAKYKAPAGIGGATTPGTMKLPPGKR